MTDIWILLICCTKFIIRILLILSYTTVVCDTSAPVNGGVSDTAIPVDDTVMYVCDEGFELLGNATATCMLMDDSSSVLSSATPTCQREMIWKSA